jgi:hypothetical protein
MRVCNLRVCDTVFVCVCLDFFNFLFLQALGFWVVFCVRFFLPLSFERERERERERLFI